tara:strand:+ start:42 stop:2333 length:2292 start_codon:yes stop_codon:yes gene_type:complete
MAYFSTFSLPVKQVFLLLLFLKTTTLIKAQTTGIITDINNQPIEAVNVLLVDQNLLLETNSEGIFIVDENIEENSDIQFFKFGYSTQILKYNSVEKMKIVLKNLHVELDEVGIIETHNFLGNSKLTNIEKKSLKNNFLNNSSIVENIIQLGGVDMISSGLGIQKIVVRGLSGMRVVTYLNGMQINNQQWANDHGIGFTDLGISEVELIKGSSALRYGSEAIGGLLYFKDNPFVYNKKPKAYFSTKFDNSSFLNRSQFGVKLNKKGIYLNFDAENTISSDYRMPNGTYFYNSRFKQNSLKLSLGYRLGKWNNIFRFQLHNEITGIPGHVCEGDPANENLNALISSEFDFEIAFDVERPTQYINNKLFIYESNFLKENVKFDLFLGYYNNNLQEYEKVTVAAFDLDLENILISPNIRYQHKDFTFNIGAQGLQTKNKNQITSRLVPDAISLNLGTYFIMDYEKKNFGINAGLRYDNKNLELVDETADFENIDYIKTFNSTSYSAGIFYKLLDHHFRISYSGAYRAPHFSELFSNGVHHGTNRFEIGDTELGIEYANQLDFKYQWSNDHFGIVINPFSQYISDFISVIPTDSFHDYRTSTGAVIYYPIYNYIQYDLVNIRGVELNLHYHPHSLHNLHIEQSFSFLNTENKDDEFGLALVPANTIRNQILYDFQNTLFEKYKVDFISFNHLYKFKQNNHAEYESPTNSYNIFNIQLGLALNEKLKSTIGINNILNTVYTPHISRVRTIAGGIPHPGRSFNINLKYDF